MKNPLNSVRESYRAIDWQTYKKFWLIIDAIAIVGVMVCACFAIFKNWDDWRDAFIPNLATELIGVWVGVRVIDAIIKRRDHHNNVRETLADSADTLTVLAHRAALRYDNELSFRTEFLMQRFDSVLRSSDHGLTGDEYKNANVFFEELQSLFNECDAQTHSDDEIDNLYLRLVTMARGTVYLLRPDDLTTVRDWTCLFGRDFWMNVEEIKQRLHSRVFTNENYLRELADQAFVQSKTYVEKSEMPCDLAKLLDDYVRSMAKRIELRKAVEGSLVRVVVSSNAVRRLA